MPKRRARGEGTLYQRKDGLWAAQITLPDGKRRTKYARSQREVRDWLGEQQSLVRQGAWSSDDSTTVEEFVRRFMADILTHRIREYTRRNYTWSIDKYIVPHIGRMRLSALRPDHVQRLYATLFEQGVQTGTIRIAHTVLGQALEQATRWKLVPRNVARLVSLPKGKTLPPEMLTDDQLRQVIAATRSGWLGIVVLIAVGTGLRRAEILGLRWMDVDLEGRALQVVNTVTVPKHSFKPVLTEPKTASSRRRVSVPAFLVDELKAWRGSCGPIEMVIPGRKGLLPPPTVNSAWKRLLQTLEIPHVRFHSLRHLHATKLLMAGISPRVVQERLGHSSVSITLGVYSHVTPSLEREAAEAVQRTTASLLRMP